MKIALITIHNANNYGAVLQAYATKKILSEYGEVSTVNYDNKFLAHHLDVIRFAPSLHGIKMLIHDLLRLPSRIRAVNRFRNFVRTNMNLTQKLTADELMHGKAGDFDVYVCGSDQIWNPDIVNKDKKIDPIFFLSFADKGAKKLSYASSIGHHNFSEDEQKEVKNLLKDFTMISTRESDGVKKLQQILPDKEINHILDPTLLLSKEEWFKALDIQPQEPKEKYILVYSVPRTGLIKKAVEYFANKLNMKVVAIDQMLFPLTKVDTHVKDAGPKEFIELFANASFVITDSFHGTCFAVNFAKPFVSISPGKTIGRIESLYKLLSIDKKILKSEIDFKDAVIDYDLSSVLKKLDENKRKSIMTLKVLKTDV